MPVSPDVGAGQAQSVTAIAERVELWLFAQLTETLKTGADRDDWADQVLARIRLWRARVERGVPGAAKELADVVAQALLGAQAEGYALAGIDLGGVTQPLPPPAGAVTSAEQLGAELAGALQQAPRLLEAILREAVHAGRDEVLGGKVTRLQAAQHVLDRLLGQGIRGYRDNAGRNWSLTSYIEMAVRTATGQTAVDAHVVALAAAGRDLVIISDSPRECPVCRPWEGKVLSISGVVGDVIVPSLTEDRGIRVKVAASLADARSAGLFHPNCTHSASMYVPGATARPKPVADPDGYEAKQRQRDMERKIREWKRREALALDPAAGARARAKVRTWQQALRDHVDAHDLKRLSRREQIGRAT